MAGVSNMATVALSALRAEIAARDPNRWPSDSPPSSDDDDFSVASSSRPLPPAETLYQNTMRHFSPRRGDGRSGSKRKRGRPTSKADFDLFLLDKPQDVLPSPKKMQMLTDKGLGPPLRNEKRIFQRSWSEEEIEDHICGSYPELKKTIGKGKMYIIPKRQLTFAEEARPQLEESDSEISEAISDAHVTAMVTNVENVEPLPSLSTTERQQELQARRDLIAQQDLSYQESLRADREKERQAQEEEEQALEKEEQKAAEEMELAELRALRREQLVAEPELGFLLRIRLPEGNCVQRRFSEGMDISALVNFIGSQDGATRSFILHIPGQLRTISSTTTDILLQDLGICSSSSINVTWQEETSESSLLGASTPALQTTSLVGNSTSEVQTSIVSLSGTTTETPQTTTLSVGNSSSDVQTFPTSRRIQPTQRSTTFIGRNRTTEIQTSTVTPSHSQTSESGAVVYISTTSTSSGPSTSTTTSRRNMTTEIQTSTVTPSYSQTSESGAVVSISTTSTSSGPSTSTTTSSGPSTSTTTSRRNMTTEIQTSTVTPSHSQTSESGAVVSISTTSTSSGPSTSTRTSRRNMLTRRAQRTARERIHIWTNSRHPLPPSPIIITDENEDEDVNNEGSSNVSTLESTRTQSSVTETDNNNNTDFITIMESLYSANDGEDMEAEDDAPRDDILPSSGQDIRDILQEWRISTLDYDETQKLSVTRRPESLWSHAVRVYSRGSFNVQKVLKVEFLNESGLDEGGLRREFFEIALRQMIASPLMEDREEGLETGKDIFALVEKKYRAIGRIFASALLQGAGVPPLLSHHMVRDDILPSSGQDIRDILQEWRISTLDYDETQKLSVTRRPESLWSHAVRVYSRGSFNVQKVLKVEFLNESGLDEGGLRREFFEIALRQMIASPLMEDREEGLETGKDIFALVEKKYRAIGRIFASALLQGAGVPPLLSHHMVRDDILPSSGQDIRDILQEWRISTLDYDETQKLSVTRRPESLWSHAVRVYSRGSFNVQKVLKVEFLNESGLDEGGLRREFFEIALRQMIASPLMEDREEGLETGKDIFALVEKKYRAIGRIFASALLQGAGVPPLLSHHMVRYGQGFREATTDTVNEDKAIIIKKVQSGLISDLRQDDSIIEAMMSAGLTVQLTENNQSSIAKALTWYNSRIREKQETIEQFWQGAEELGLQKLLIQYPAKIEPILCRTCGTNTDIKAVEFMALLHIDTHGERGSNERMMSEDTAQNLESFVYDCEDKKCGDLTVGDILQWTIGCSKVPPGGLEKKINIHFTTYEQYPTVSTCSLDMTLPLYLHNSYNKFKDIMIEAILSGQGFGTV